MSALAPLLTQLLIARLLAQCGRTPALKEANASGGFHGSPPLELVLRNDAATDGAVGSFDLDLP
jgi:ABC-type branched-subunit amino acid transport system substrate-binding protein